MDVIKYILGVAVAAFLAGISALLFLDDRIDKKLVHYRTQEPVTLDVINQQISMQVSPELSLLFDKIRELESRAC